MSFGNVIRSGSIPASVLYGSGGNKNNIWIAGYSPKLIYELSTTDFSIVQSDTAPSLVPYGIGGDSDTIWHCDSNTKLIYELNTSDLSVIRSASSPGIDPVGIGGDSNTIWHCDDDDIYELDADVPTITTISLGKQNARGMSIPGGMSMGRSRR